ncbi:MAG: glycosyltransferase family 2 protein [bacterium]
MKELPEPPKGKSGWPWTEETDISIYKELKSLPKFSIITPSFNQGKFIEHTIRSVLLQNYPNLEYIIMDGGSTDETAEIIKKYEPWIKHWESKEDRGQSHAINKGLMKCEGEIFNWLNSDDYYNKDCFKFVAENFRNKDVQIVAGNYRFFDNDETRKEKIINFKLRNSLEETIAFILINQPSTFFRMEIFKNLGELDERLQFVMDQDIWKKYLFRYGQSKIKILDKDLTNFRFHAQSKTFQFEFNNEYAGIFYSIAQKTGMERHATLLKKIYGNDIGEGYDFNFNFSEKNIDLVKKVINNLVFSNARNFLTANKIEEMNECLAVLETKWLNKKQKDYARTLKVKSKLIKFKLKPMMKLFGSRKPKTKPAVQN